MIDPSVPSLIVCHQTTDQTGLALELLKHQFEWSGSSLEHSDIHLFDGRETGLKIEEVRDLNQELQYQPISGLTYAVVLGLEKASLPAQQALLKMLEEPPAYVRWLLICSNVSNVLPTIQSRCSVQDQSNQVSEISNEIKTETLELLEKISVSSAGEALALSDSFSDRAAAEAQLGHLIRLIHQQPATPMTVRQLQVLSETQQLLRSNVNLKLALGECFLALRTAEKPDQF